METKMYESDFVTFPCKSSWKLEMENVIVLEHNSFQETARYWRIVYGLCNDRKLDAEIRALDNKLDDCPYDREENNK